MVFIAENLLWFNAQRRCLIFLFVVKHAHRKDTKQILKDEISHVRFGMRWIEKLKANDQDAFELYKESIKESLPLKRARGFIFQEEYRKEAGVPDSWIAAIKHS